jgi:hypothetical protein
MQSESQHHGSIHPGIASILRVLRRRQRLVNVLRWSIHGLFSGAVLACVAAPIAWAAFHTAGSNLAFLALGFVLTGAAIGTAIACLLPTTDLKLARALDRASSGEDQFASALQLAHHHHQERAALVAQDALARVEKTSPAAALPARMPREARWLPLPIVAVVAFMILAPTPRTEATATPEPEISADDWATLHDEFAKEVAQLPKPLSPDEEELQKELEQLAAKLAEKPDKKDALHDIARLSEKIEQQRRAVGARAVSLRAAAKAMNASRTLAQFASKLQAGEYEQAAGELKKTSEQLKNAENAPDGTEFESIASDLERLAEKIKEEQELAQECKNGANAAASMNRQQLSEALKRLAEQMAKNAQRMKKGDGLSRRQSMLDELRRRMGQCQNPGDRPGNQPGRGAGKGGLKPGWGSAAKWDGGDLAKNEQGNTPELSDALERPGVSTTFPITSPDERAKSGKAYEELYAEFAQKAEADLDLESVPVSYREFLKRYFNAIKPPEAAPAEAPAGTPEATEDHTP